MSSVNTGTPPVRSAADIGGLVARNQGLALWESPPQCNARMTDATRAAEADIDPQMDVSVWTVDGLYHWRAYMRVSGSLPIVAALTMDARVTAGTGVEVEVDRVEGEGWAPGAAANELLLPAVLGETRVYVIEGVARVPLGAINGTTRLGVEWGAANALSDVTMHRGSHFCATPVQKPFAAAFPDATAHRV